MKIVCIANNIYERDNGDRYINLTIGKTYIALTQMLDDDIMVEMIDDVGEKCWYPKKNFKLLNELRGEKLNQLGI